MGTISVIIPAYNHAPYVVESLESVFRQTRKPMEIIVIDDASTDNTANVIEQYLRRLGDSKRRKVRFICHKKNLTPTPTFNEGMANARGDYLVFLPADDWYAPTMLFEEAEILDAHPEIGVVYSQTISVRDGERRLAVPEPAGTETVIGREEFGRLLTMGDFVALPTVIMRRALVAKFGGWDRNLRFHADYEFFIRMAKHSLFAYLAKPLTYYRLHAANDHLHPDFLSSYEREFAYILEKQLPASDSALQSLRHDAYHFYYFRLFMHYVVQGRFVRGLSFLWKSFLAKPWSRRHLTAWMPFGWYLKRKIAV